MPDNVMHGEEEPVHTQNPLLCLLWDIIYGCWQRLPTQSKRSSASASRNARSVQVVGLRGGWHTAGTMAGVFNRLHGKRLAQAAEVIIELRAQGVPPARV